MVKQARSENCVSVSVRFCSSRFSVPSVARSYRLVPCYTPHKAIHCTHSYGIFRAIFSLILDFVSVDNFLI